MRDKRGKEVLAQSTSMIMVVSSNFPSKNFLSVVRFFPHHFSFLLQSVMATPWAYQDYERPLDLSNKQVAKRNLLKEHMVEAEKKLAANEEGLKANEVELVAKVEELKKARTEVRQLGGELTRIRDKVRSLRSQLE